MNFSSPFIPQNLLFHFCSILFLIYWYRSMPRANGLDATPSELLPGVRPLGSMQGRKYQSKRPLNPVAQVRNWIVGTTHPGNSAPPLPQPRDFSEFHSNLGRQPIVEKLPQPVKIGLEQLPINYFQFQTAWFDEKPVLPNLECPYHRSPLPRGKQPPPTPIQPKRNYPLN